MRECAATPASTLSLGPDLHRVLLAVVLLGNAIAFAGIDAPARAITALLVLVLMIDLGKVPPVPALFRVAGLTTAVVLGLSLLPLPLALRRLLQPGFGELLPGGWAPLSVAPWATVELAASLVIAGCLALVAARMAATRTGLPTLLTIIAATACLVALLGLVTEAALPEKVLAVRANTGGGEAYGPYVNHNHFALGLELSLPAVVVLLAVGSRHLRQYGAGRRRAVLIVLTTTLVTITGVAALLRCGSRGGLLALPAAWLITLPLWRKAQRARRWVWLLLVVVLLAGSLSLAWTQLPRLQDELSELLVLEGVDGNTRWDLWAGTLRLWQRAPLLGTGAGSYAHVIGLDKPATQEQSLESAHNSWLEWLATTGVVGLGVLLLVVAGLVAMLRPRQVARLRFEYRYPVAGAAWVVAAVTLHEMVGFGLSIPLNRYLLAVWLGLLWGLSSKVGTRSNRATSGQPAAAEGPPERDLHHA